MDSAFITPWYVGENTWHPPHWLKYEADLGMKYFHSFFWGAGMVTSLVPRDIEPVTIMESVLTTTTMFFGLLLNAFVISSLTQALQTMNSKKELTGKKLDMIKSYLLVKTVPADLRSRILEYFEYLYTSSAALNNNQRDMFQDMPPALSAQLALSTNRKLAAKCGFFRDVTNATFIKVITDLRPTVFVPEQVIVREGLALTSIYFINRGIVQVVAHEMAVGTMTNNDNFGLDDYFDASVGSVVPTVKKTITAVTYCDMMELYVGELDDLLRVDKKFQDALKERRKGAKEDKSMRPTTNRANTSKWRCKARRRGIHASSNVGGGQDSHRGGAKEGKSELKACVNLGRKLSKLKDGDGEVEAGGQATPGESTLRAAVVRVASRFAQDVGSMSCRRNSLSERSESTPGRLDA